MSSVTAPNGALSVQSQNQPVQSEENCCQRAWRWIAETASCIWEAVMGFFRGLCCSQPSSQQSSIVAQTSSQATTRQVAPTVVTTGSATEPTPSAPPQESTLPNGTVYFDPNPSAERALKEQLDGQLRHPTVARTRLCEEEFYGRLINETFSRMQSVQGSLRSDPGFDTTVGCLLSRNDDNVPVLFIVVPYRDGVVEFLRREFGTNGIDRENMLPQWQIYTDGNRRFIGGLWQELIRGRTRTEELPPALVPYVGPHLP